jgi:hypothetical protein
VTPVRKLLREPLVHFLVGGALLFALEAWLGSSTEGPSYDVHVGPGQIARLEQAWQAQSGRPPSDAELRAIIEDHVREEIFYREAIRRGLDEGDVLVRRRLAQKLAFLIEDLAAVDEPRDEDLRRFHAERAERYAEPARVSFRHVFFSRDRREDPAGDAARALTALRSTSQRTRRESSSPVELAGAGPAGAAGDPFMLHSEYAGRSHQEVRELFGVEFADALFALDGTGWHGPVRSSYGEHLVEVISRADERVPPFDEVREAVVRDFRHTRREQANENAYRDMRSRYDVVVGEPASEGEDGSDTAG